MNADQQRSWTLDEPAMSRHRHLRPQWTRSASNAGCSQLLVQLMGALELLRARRRWLLDSIRSIVTEPHAWHRRRGTRETAVAYVSRSFRIRAIFRCVSDQIGRAHV